MALGSTQPLTEMSTRSISWGKGGRCVRLTTYHHLVLLSRNLGTLTSWNLLGLSRPVMGLLYLYMPTYNDGRTRISIFQRRVIYIRVDYLDYLTAVSTQCYTRNQRCSYSWSILEWSILWVNMVDQLYQYSLILFNLSRCQFVYFPAHGSQSPFYRSPQYHRRK